MIKHTETNYTMQANVISALKQANKERGEAINDFAESNARLRVEIAELTKVIVMMKADIADVTQKLKEAIEA